MNLRKIKNIGLLIAYVLAIYIFFPNNAYAMHIMEGFLPFNWAAFWWLVMIPFVIAGVRSIKKSQKELQILAVFTGKELPTRKQGVKT